MATIVEPVAAEPIPMPRHRWTTAEFDRLVAEGFIREGGKTFLWDGEIIDPMAEDNAHINAAENLADLLKRRLPTEAWTVNSGRPLALGEGFLPQPDLSVLIGPRSRYRSLRPSAEHARLVVEVANTSYAFDSGAYLRHYALAGIPIYWIVHLKARKVEVHAQPDRQAGCYGLRSIYGIDQIVPLILDGQEFESIAVEAILRDSIGE